MKNVAANARFWIAGIIVAISGVACARVIGPSLTGTWRISTIVGGQLFALSGLFIICVGVRRRLRNHGEVTAQSPAPHRFIP